MFYLIHILVFFLNIYKKTILIVTYMKIGFVHFKYEYTTCIHIHQFFSII